MDKMEYMVVWNTEDCIDGIPEEDFEEAKATALTILDEWCNDGIKILQDNDFSDEVRRGWNEMIENYWVEIQRYNPETKQYEDYWSPSDEDLERVGYFGWFPVATLPEIFEEFEDKDVSES
jgi:hypothetical protein